ncbi:hypothetical protein D3Z58_03200 [Clostridiaceae bacterium]|nr:hypothetical protein [Clostridiaceae bacterium]
MALFVFLDRDRNNKGKNIRSTFHYASLIRAKFPTNGDAHLTESNFQTRSIKRSRRLSLRGRL